MEDDMVIYMQKIKSTNDIFKNKGITIMGGNNFNDMEITDHFDIPDDIVHCAKCNGNIYPEDGWMVCFGVLNFESDNWSDIYHEECTTNFIDEGQVVKVDGYLYE